MVGGEIELGCERCVTGAELEALGGGLVEDRQISLTYRLIALEQRERGQHDSDDQADGQHGPLQPGGTVRCSPGRRDERPLAAGRRGLWMSVPFGQPRLRRPQVPAAEQATAVTAAAVTAGVSPLP